MKHIIYIFILPFLSCSHFGGERSFASDSSLPAEKFRFSSECLALVKPLYDLPESDPRWNLAVSIEDLDRQIKLVSDQSVDKEDPYLRRMVILDRIPEISRQSIIWSLGELKSRGGYSKLVEEVEAQCSIDYLSNELVFSDKFYEEVYSF